MEYQRVFLALNMPPSRYMTHYAFPILGVTATAALVSAAWIAPFLPEIARPLVPLLAVAFGLLAAAFYPLAVVDRKRNEINVAIPFFMTHFGVLSTSNTPRAEIIRMLSEKREYKALAEELRKIHGLVANWNLSLPEAARTVGKSTPSHILADFLDRLAHALETGQDLEVFLRNEQSVVMKDYATVYDAAVYQLESMKEMYMSLMLSGVFLIILALVMPLVTGSPPETILTGAILLFVFVEALFLLFARIRAPSDPLWHDLPIPTRERTRIRVLLAASVPVSVLLALLLPPVLPFPFAISLAIGLTPLAGVGLYASVAEGRVKRREDNYAAFIRSLGASMSARGGSMREVLRKLKAHNFGPLTEMVHELYARLSWRLNDALAWRHFSAESGSNLVEKFNDMFVEGIKAGGKPQQVGEIISDNVGRLLSLRKARYSTASGFTRLAVGFTGGMTFAMFIGVGMLGVMSTLFQTTLPDNNLVPFDFGEPVDVRPIHQALVGVLLFHAVVAGLIAKIADGGSLPAGLTVVVVSFWIAAVVSMMGVSLVEGLLKSTAG